MWCDIIGAMYLSLNPVLHAKTKHVEIDFHFGRDTVANKLISFNFISTKDQLADIFTKPLSSPWFSTLRDKLNVISILLSLKGRIRDIQLMDKKTIQNLKIQDISLDQMTSSNTS